MLSRGFAIFVIAFLGEIGLGLGLSKAWSQTTPIRIATPIVTATPTVTPTVTPTSTPSVVAGIHGIYAVKTVHHVPHTTSQTAIDPSILTDPEIDGIALETEWN